MKIVIGEIRGSTLRKGSDIWINAPKYTEYHRLQRQLNIEIEYLNKNEARWKNEEKITEIENQMNIISNKREELYAEYERIRYDQFETQSKINKLKEQKMIYNTYNFINKIKDEDLRKKIFIETINQNSKKEIFDVEQIETSIKSFSKTEEDINKKTDEIVKHLLNDYDVKEYFPTKAKHGFTGFIYLGEDGKLYISFTLHTSKEKFNLFGLDINNIKVNEELNHIIYVNQMQTMSLEDFTNFFEIKSPDTMLSSPRYNNQIKHDLAYLAARAGAISLTQTTKAIDLRTEPTDWGNIKINYINDSIIVNEIKEAKTPAVTIIEDAALHFSESDIESFISELNNGKDSIEYKQDLLERIDKNFYDFFKGL